MSSATNPDHNVLYPLFLKLAGRPVLVVGAGGVGERKVDELLLAAASVRLVAPEASARLKKLHVDGTIRWYARRFEPSDIDGVWLVVAATGDPRVQRAVFDVAEQRRTFVVAVDDPTHGSAQTPAIVRRDPYVLAISSGGASPALTRLLREMLEQVLPDADWVEAARALRAKWQAEGTPMASRFPELVRAFRERARE